MLRYLGIIEERTNQLLIAQTTINAKVENNNQRIFDLYFVLSRNKIYRHVNVYHQILLVTDHRDQYLMLPFIFQIRECDY